MEEAPPEMITFEPLDGFGKTLVRGWRATYAEFLSSWTESAEFDLAAFASVARLARGSALPGDAEILRKNADFFEYLSLTPNCSTNMRRISFLRLSSGHSLELIVSRKKAEGFQETFYEEKLILGYREGSKLTVLEVGSAPFELEEIEKDDAGSDLTCLWGQLLEYRGKILLLTAVSRLCVVEPPTASSPLLIRKVTFGEEEPEDLAPSVLTPLRLLVDDTSLTPTLLVRLCDDLRPAPPFMFRLGELALQGHNYQAEVMMSVCLPPSFDNSYFEGGAWWKNNNTQVDSWGRIWLLEYCDEPWLRNQILAVYSPDFSLSFFGSIDFDRYIQKLEICEEGKVYVSLLPYNISAAPENYQLFLELERL